VRGRACMCGGPKVNMDYNAIMVGFSLTFTL
jgi:hypothetical protein